jgi:hypothetical protein
MQIEDIIKSIHGWVRLTQARKIPSGLELRFGIHKEDRGRKKTGMLIVTCRGVREAHITAFDGGGLRVYPATHTAARQYNARRLVLRWDGGRDPIAALGVLYDAHTSAVDDWIPFDRYVSLKSLSGAKCYCRGPDFLMTAYAAALQAIGKAPRLTKQRNPPTRTGTLKVLHFGDSFVVATGFAAQRILR